MAISVESFEGSFSISARPFGGAQAAGVGETVAVHSRSLRDLSVRAPAVPCIFGFQMIVATAGHGSDLLPAITGCRTLGLEDRSLTTAGAR